MHGLVGFVFVGNVLVVSGGCVWCLPGGVMAWGGALARQAVTARLEPGSQHHLPPRVVAALH